MKKKSKEILEDKVVSAEERNSNASLSKDSPVLDLYTNREFREFYFNILTNTHNQLIKNFEPTQSYSDRQ